VAVDGLTMLSHMPPAMRPLILPPALKRRLELPSGVQRLAVSLAVAPKPSLHVFVEKRVPLVAYALIGVAVFCGALQGAHRRHVTSHLTLLRVSHPIAPHHIPSHPSHPIASHPIPSVSITTPPTPGPDV
jgi:hypothetical protein